MVQTLSILARDAFASPDKVLLERPRLPPVTYGDFDRLSARLAHAVSARGVDPGDRVAVQVEKSVEALALYIACMRVGAVYVPLNTAYTAAEMQYFIADAEPSLVVCDPAQAAQLAPLAENAGSRIETLDADGKGTLVDLASTLPDTFSGRAAKPDDVAAILYTSGTTGRSKGAMLTQGNLLSNALALTNIWRFSSDDVLLHALPIYHTHGLFVATNVILRAGASMIYLPKFDVDEVISLLPRATAMMGVPTFYTRLLAHPGFTREAASSIRLFISGSAPLLASTHEEFSARTGHAILERYGMTETGMITSNPYDGDRIAGTVGFPLPEVEIRVAQPDTGEVLAQGEIGVVEVRGPNVFKGYWRMPEKTAQEFRADGFFVTGDIGRIDERGNLHIVGRSKDLIITGGFNVYPKEIELAIDALEGVAETAVIGIPHPDFGEGVMAAVVPQPGVELNEAQILERIRGNLAKFKQPKRIVIVPELPRNTMGKVQKNVLREQYRDMFAPELTLRA
ncbi:malonate--CoA ligase [Microvirga brassicacearum]|uniref:AMP-binding protein n=1 Tax=Microvirga brassicacearum TaxID=2580413 RepID=A0A5N3PAM1_9HYPH|nr:malonyl-CoA synthase [Microvirga brassicacearum]KAB0266780.1 AMP-binding protein [Microvirga brassicacearum]